MTKQLDLTSFRNALDRLAEALDFCASPAAKRKPRFRQFFQGGAIQAFGYSYELNFKMLKRWLEIHEVSAGAVDAMSFNDLVRRGYEAGLLQAELAVWQDFRQNRNRSSHVYNAETAEEVYLAIPAFQAQAEFLYKELVSRQKAAEQNV